MIGVLGGTFDPIHYGHLRPAQEAMRALGLRELRIIPAGQPPHRAAVASVEHRLEMVRLACSEFPGFIVDEREIRRAGPSYTVDTLASIRAEAGKQSLCLLMGSDAFQGIESWREWRRLPELAHVVVMYRPGCTLPGLAPWARERLAETPAQLADSAAGRLLFQKVAPLDISGTRLRAAIARGESVDAWLPSTVRDYLRSHHVYPGTER
jgi:nicotinate-nucleotide adenylyltransferase